MQNGLGVWIPCRGVRIPGIGLQSLFEEIGFWILNSFSCIPKPMIPDSTIKIFLDSGIPIPYLGRNVRSFTIISYKITKIVRTLWLAEGRVCMRVCKHGCDVKMFCFSRAYHANMNLKKVLSRKPRQVYFIYPFPRRLKLGKSLETCCVNFFFRFKWHFKQEKPVFWKISFLQNKNWLRQYNLRAQDFATGKNLSFNHCSKQRSFAFFLGKLFYKSNRKPFFLCLYLSNRKRFPCLHSLI